MGGFQRGGASMGEGAGAAVLDEPPVDPFVEPRTVGSVVQAFIAAQRAEILAGEERLRAGMDAAEGGDTVVHKTRVAVRRLRSALRIVTIADPAATAALDRELAWFAQVLGDVRDRDVLREHLQGTAASVPGAARLRDTLAHLDAVLDAEQRAARNRLRAALDGHRYRQLQLALATWSEAPPFGSAAGRPAEDLVDYVQRSRHLVAKRLAGAHGTAEGLHRARKAAKRARYVAEFAAPVSEHATATSEQAKKLQEVLGDHQDCVMAGEFLARVVTAAPLPVALGCGVLWAQERRAAARLRSRAAAVSSYSNVLVNFR